MRAGVHRPLLFYSVIGASLSLGLIVAAAAKVC